MHSVEKLKMHWFSKLRELNQNYSAVMNDMWFSIGSPNIKVTINNYNTL